MAGVEHYKKKGERENKTRLLALIKQHGSLTFSQMKGLLNVSSATLSSYLRALETTRRIERFRNPNEDRRIEHYRIGTESREKVDAELGKYEAIKFIESIPDPVYVYLEKNEGKQAIAAFSSVPKGVNREEIRKGQKHSISFGLGLLKTKLLKDQKIALIIMAKGQAEQKEEKGSE